MAANSGWVQWASNAINWLIGTDNSLLARVSALETKQVAQDATVTSLQEAFAKYVADVNSKLTALSAQIAATPGIDAADQTALQSLLAEIQSADAALNPAPTPATPAS